MSITLIQYNNYKYTNFNYNYNLHLIEIQKVNYN